MFDMLLRLNKLKNRPNLECYTFHDRRLGGIGREVPIARCSRCLDWFGIAEGLS